MSSSLTAGSQCGKKGMPWFACARPASGEILAWLHVGGFLCSRSRGSVAGLCYMGVLSGRCQDRVIFGVHCVGVDAQ